MDWPGVVILLSNYSTILSVGDSPPPPFLYRQGSEYEEDLGRPSTREQVRGVSLLRYTQLYLHGLMSANVESSPPARGGGP